MPADVATQLVRAVSTQNEAALVVCFSPDVEFRALIPPRPEGAHWCARGGGVVL